MSKPSVFISWMQRDAALAQRFEAALRHAGVNASNPTRDAVVGEDWRKSTRSAIKSADAVIVLALAPQNLSSSWMSYEAGLAEALGKRIMLLLPNRNSVADLPADFASTQVVQFDPQSPESAARDIASRLGVV
ncbi:MAG TPA: toll/interleukin-1 receptor domain-containing protein [Xanthobacteraceae bacterium]|jgi:TIR domain